jgi:hypothetical protein
MTKNKTKPFEPAFNYNIDYPEEGLTKREYFAAMALQGLLASGLMDRCGENTLALHSVTAANALIETLNNTDNPNLQP